MSEKKKNKEKKEGKVGVVLRTDLHCKDCASKIIKTIQEIDGVDKVILREGQMIMVVGEVDPGKLRQKLDDQIHRKVELISPAPASDGKKNKGHKSNKDMEEIEPEITTAVLRLNLHCDGCIKKIRKTVAKAEGYKDMKIDKQKNLVLVTGSMDMEELAESLEKQLSRKVEMIPLKKEEKPGKKSGDSGDKAEEKSGKNKAQTPNQSTHNPNFFGAQFSQNPNPFGAQFDQNPNPFGPQFSQNPNPFGPQFNQNPNPYGAQFNQRPSTYGNQYPYGGSQFNQYPNYNGAPFHGTPISSDAEENQSLCSVM